VKFYIYRDPPTEIGTTALCCCGFLCGFASPKISPVSDVSSGESKDPPV